MWHLQLWKCHSIFLKCYLIFTTFINNCYPDNIKDHRIGVPIELFSIFWKFERTVVLRTRLTRKFRLRWFITLIYGYSFQFWIRLLVFQFFPDPLEVIGTPCLLIFWLCKVWNYLSFFWTKLTLNYEAQNNFLCSNLSSLPS